MDSRMSLRWIATVAVANLMGAMVFVLRVSRLLRHPKLLPLT